MTQSTENLSPAFKIADPGSPMTEKQAPFLASLVAERENPRVAERYRLLGALGGLTKGIASEMISELLDSPKIKDAAKKAAHAKLLDNLAKGLAIPLSVISDDAPKPSNHAQPGLAIDVNAPVKVELPRMPKFGYYEIDGKLYYWDVTGKDSAPVLRRWTAPGWGKVNYTWQKVNLWSDGTGKGASIKLEGTYTPFKGGKYEKPQVTTQVWVKTGFLAAIKAGATPMTLDAVKAKGKALNFCVRCGAPLTDPVSVANGIGPVCATYWH